jgi:hypothetical protein
VSGELPLVDLIVTHYPKNDRRREIARRSLFSLGESLKSYPSSRVTLVIDGPDAEPWRGVHRLITHSENMGLGPSINEAMAIVQAENRWHEERGEDDRVAPLVCYLQDDVQYSPGWLERLVKTFLQFESPLRLAFATGVECPEHPVRQRVRDDVWTKDWIRMTCMLARREYFASMFPIPGMDVETGRKRARPHDGVGSSCDWWLIRNHLNSPCRTGRTNLVLPGLLTHIGYRDSTWLARELPESDADKARMG